MSDFAFSELIITVQITKTTATAVSIAVATLLDQGCTTSQS